MNTEINNEIKTIKLPFTKVYDVPNKKNHKMFVDKFFNKLIDNHIKHEKDRHPKGTILSFTKSTSTNVKVLKVNGVEHIKILVSVKGIKIYIKFLILHTQTSH